ncbi:MAG: FAD-dependent oxidoreductase [Pseudomonadota bacterium]
MQSITGFENAHICRPGYAIEYDFFTLYLKCCVHTRN